MSDLIERYGYERAVRELKAMDDRAIWMISSCLKYREEVRKECLDYRRANNIFEKGDMVIFSILGNEVIQYGGWLESQNKDWMRHATDAEIKAGRRL